MNLKDLNQSLRTQARNLGLCDKWYNEWSDSDSLMQLADKFFLGIDFCIEHRFPAPANIRDLFPLSFLRQNGIIVNDSYSLLNRPYAAIMGDSSTTIRTNAWAKTVAYALDNSTVNVEAKGNSTIFLHVFDNTKITASTQALGRIIIFLHSTAATIRKSGCVTIRQELNYLQ